MKRLTYAFLVTGLAGLLSGCGQPTNPPPGSAAPARPTTSTTSAPAAVSTSDLVIAFQDLELAVATFRNLEAANTNSSSVLAGVGYAAAASSMQKKRDAFDRMLAAATPENVPGIDQIRQAYVPYNRALKAYVTVCNVGGLISGPNARNTTPSYLLVVAEGLKFKSGLKNIQNAALSPMAPSASKTPAPGNDIIAAEKASQAAYQKLQSLIQSQADAAAVKAAAAEYDQAKKRLEELTRR